MRQQYRQGDVYLLEIDQLPPEVVSGEVRGTDRIVLAYGEATGHSHSISQQEATLYNRGDLNYLVVDTQALLIHEEHRTIALPAGVYIVVRQKEYEPVHGAEYVID